LDKTKQQTEKHENLNLMKTVRGAMAGKLITDTSLEKYVTVLDSYNKKFAHLTEEVLLENTELKLKVLESFEFREKFREQKIIENKLISENIK
jgi:hypothetical protein